MNTLEQAILQRENSFIATVEGILKQDCSNRIKMVLINKQYIKCLVALDDLVAEVKLATPPAGEASSN